MTGVQTLIIICALALSCIIAVTAKNLTTNNDKDPVKDLDNAISDSE